MYVKESYLSNSVIYYIPTWKPVGDILKCLISSMNIYESFIIDILFTTHMYLHLAYNILPYNIIIK